ncbi:MAG: GTPase [Candidatus Solincola sediminis]|uniref:GTPase n=1 Tax=Candidatus Solincola sediminis TaxID=1797199 RepID=A0A1F2WM88_9ACTN|nr:MAG: GTPase [Candidatus Solincola sediminis]
MTMDLYEGIRARNRLAAARLISLVENDDASAREVMRRLHQHTGKAHIVGITGATGSGKSTLVSALTKALREHSRTVGIIAIDPTSPFTGGAVLGDRIRMQELATDPGVFIRSMGTRGALGGLAVATNDAVNILDAFGKEVIIVETVGAGQVEVDIVGLAHTSIVVTMPGGGDEIQAMKAGIMEIGDIFVVNKADREGADRAAAEIEMMVEIVKREPAYIPPILRTVATEGLGVDGLCNAIFSHYDYLQEHGLLEEKVRVRIMGELLEIINHRVHLSVTDALEHDPEMLDLMKKLVDTREIDPHSGAAMVIRHLMKRE